MNFSTALKLNDIDDYIAPSLECIKPIKIPTSLGKTTSITIGEDGTYVATNASGEKYTLAKAKIDLNDCLACSGCITTAETILVAQHGVETFLNLFKDPGRYEVVVALSPQSLASLTSSLQSVGESSLPQRLVEAFKEKNGESDVTMGRVRMFCSRLLRSYGVYRPLIDTTWGRDIALSVAAEEFVDSFTNPSAALKLPVLTGICPGWVCYAEKTHLKLASKPPNNEDRNEEESLLLQHISRVRSPQQLLAGVLKRSGIRTLDPRRRLFLVFVMPCFDKKLEASRTEFDLDVEGSMDEKEADLVLGTNEFVTVLDSLVQTSPPEFKETKFEETSEDQRLWQLMEQAWDEEERDGGYRHAGSGSGGYAFAVLRYAAHQLFHLTLPLVVTEDLRVFTRYLSNHDLQEILLFSSVEDCEAARKNAPIGRTPYRHTGVTPAPLLAFLVANGFRNIQTVVQQLKRAHIKARAGQSSVRTEAPFDYIEIMACPNGCLNGGAQLKNEMTNVSNIYFSLGEKDILQDELPHRILGRLNPITKQRVCYTTFRTVPQVKIINPSTLKW